MSIQAANEALQAALTDVEARIMVLAGERDAIKRALAALDGTTAAPAEPAVKADPPKPKPKPKPASAAKSGAMLTCPECGVTAKGKIGLGIHRAKVHGVKGATTTAGKGAANPKAVPKPVEPATADELVPAAAKPEPFVVGNKVLACDDCPSTFGAVNQLEMHTRGRHGRPAYRTEKTPVDRSELEVAS